VPELLRSGLTPTGPAERIAAGIRRRVLAHVLANDGGYMSQACSAAEILATIYSGAVDLTDVDSPYEPPPFIAVPVAQHREYRERCLTARRRRIVTA